MRNDRDQAERAVVIKASFEGTCREIERLCKQGFEIEEAQSLQDRRAFHVNLCREDCPAT
ncbi:MAG: hypothetical protein AAF682_04730 [Planctomycetota bacterium]